MAFPSEFRSVSFRGVRIAYQVLGSGPAIVLLKNNRVPRDFPAAQVLSDRFRVLQVHPAGFGASDRPARFDFGDVASQVLAVLDQEQVDRFVVWGFSQCAAMAAMVARPTPRAVALVAGGFQLLDTPTEASMRRMEREPRIRRPALEFWRAYRAIDWAQELPRMACPKLVYMGTADPAWPRMRRYEPGHCGVDYLEFEGLDHATAGLGAPPPQADITVDAVAAWLHRNLDRAW